MQKRFNIQFSFTVSGDNSEQIKNRLEEFKRDLISNNDGISEIYIDNIVQTDGDDIEETTGLTVEDVINSCAETNRILTEEEAHEILKRYNQGCIDNPNCEWYIVVEILADEIIDNRDN